jgi:uncharacterized protein YoxC
VIDFGQLVLGLVLVTLTVMLSLIAYQTAKVLQEFRKTIEKMNKVLEDAGTISESISKPVNLISMFLQKKIS